MDQIGLGVGKTWILPKAMSPTGANFCTSRRVVSALLDDSDES